MKILSPLTYQSQERNTGYLDNHTSDSRNVTNSMTFSTKSSNQNVIVFLNNAQATIVEDKSCDFLAVLD
ncbi:hypothetical protein TREES_T100020520 [Tupaia chinensis]|uniref:Uncharacterized protein n=1 Tax=Tupaia chinensis TaxID=246437 RepID=L9KVT9_TUPCH|nr:hypothetical protein TREES_T100020520 [Tupaia chinensis]